MNAGSSEGLAAVNRAAHEYGAAIGIWLSSWGGYEEANKRSDSTWPKERF